MIQMEKELKGSKNGETRIRNLQWEGKPNEMVISFNSDIDT